MEDGYPDKSYKNNNKQDNRPDIKYGSGSQDNLLLSNYISPKQDNLVDDIGYGLGSQDNLLHSSYFPKHDNLVDDTHRDIGYGLEYFFTFKHISKKQNTLVNDTYLDFRSGLASQVSLENNKNEPATRQKNRFRLYAAIILVNDTYLDFGTGLASQDNLENKTDTRGDIGFGSGLVPRDNLQNNKNKQDIYQDIEFGLGFQDNFRYSQCNHNNLTDDTR
ncbi:11154_t:CDS:2, partial [Funneliformis caledonium]